MKFSAPKENSPKCIKTKEEDNNIIKVFKFDSQLIKENKVIFEFSFDEKKYKITLENIKGKTFIFDVILQVKTGIFNGEQKIEQKIGLSEKMNYFLEALEQKKENDKLDILFMESINLCLKRPNFHFLINIFIHVYNNKLCSNLLDIFDKNIDKPGQRDNIDKDILLKYKFDFEQICENPEEIISKYTLQRIDFYGLILCYYNNCRFEKYRELFDNLYKADKNILFDIMLKYKLYFKKQIDLNESLLNEIIKYSTTKEFKAFKEDGLYYLKDINSFIDIINNNKNEIIKIKEFTPIEIPKIGEGEKIDYEKIYSKIEEIINFSKENKIILIFFKLYFWESLAKKYSEIRRENIEICFKLKNLLTLYNTTINFLLKEDKNNPIKKEINATWKRGIFTHQIDKIMKEYIKNSQKITNLEIIELIKDYNKYYTEDSESYIKRRDPDILSRIDFEEINDEFILKFKNMKFEKIFKTDISNFYLIFTNKIKKLNDFNIILKLIDIDALESDKTDYLRQLKNKFNLAIKDGELTENNISLIKILADLTSFICLNEKNIDFLKNYISKSNKINEKIKHKIYMELIKFCNKSKNEEMKKFIISIYYGL